MADRRAIRDTLRQFAATMRSSSAGFGGKSIPRGYDPGILVIRNDSGEDQGEFAVLGIDEPVVRLTDDTADSFLGHPEVSATTPQTSAHLGKFVVLIETIASGDTGRAVVSGVVPVRVYVNSVNDKFCDVSRGRADGSGTCYLATGNGGAQILWLDETAQKGTIAWAIIRLGHTPQWARLVNDLYQCSSAEAVLLVADTNDMPCDAGDQITVSDPHGVVAASRLATGEQTLYIPAGSHVFVSPVRGTKGWVAVAFGSGSCCGGTSSSSSSSSSSKSSSSSSSSQSSSSSKSSSSQSSQSSGSGSGSDKSTAIVPASWTPTGYTALFIAECPEVRFDDVMTVVVDKPDATFPIDARFAEVCELGSIEVCGCVPDVPVLIGAFVEPRRPDALEAVRIRIGGAEEWPVRVAIRLTGIRKGFADHRFPSRTRNQFEANERFIRSAYPDEQ